MADTGCNLRSEIDQSPRKRGNMTTELSQHRKCYQLGFVY